ncbi:MAG: 3-deoxy-D-manno-octulosonic acid transferase [Phycisphaeraceae bacterium]
MPLRYDIAYSIAGLAAAPVLGYRMLRTGKWRTDWSGRLGRGPALHNGEAERAPTILLHAVSVGEVNAIRLLVQHLAGRDDAPRLVISTTTDTGHARATELYANHHTVVRYPLDFTPCVRRFLDRVQPDVVALTELELWPNFVAQCAKRDIPVCVINGRLSDRSFRNYRRFTPLVRPTFAGVTVAAVQSPTYASRFEALGTPIERIRVLDTMKWDTAELADDVPGSDALARAMGIDPSRPVVVAGSTGDGEEQMLIDLLPTWPEGTQLLLVPRKPERFDEVAQLAPHAVRRSEHPDDGTPSHPGSPYERRVLLLDTMGELRKAYALANVAIVGRSFNGWGGSDPIDPIALGCPTIIGPDHANFHDVVAAMRGAGGIRVTDTPGPVVAELLDDAETAYALAEAGRAVIRRRQGATDRHAELLMELLAEKKGAEGPRGRGAE